MSLAFEIKTFSLCKEVILKSHDSQIVPKSEFKNGRTTILISTLRVLLNILSISLLSRVHDTFGYFEMHNDK